MMLQVPTSGDALLFAGPGCKRIVVGGGLLMVRPTSLGAFAQQ